MRMTDAQNSKHSAAAWASVKMRGRAVPPGLTQSKDAH
jgi:hypothetical protein